MWVCSSTVGKHINHEQFSPARKPGTESVFLQLENMLFLARHHKTQERLNFSTVPAALHLILTLLHEKVLVHGDDLAAHGDHLLLHLEVVVAAEFLLQLLDAARLAARRQVSVQRRLAPHLQEEMPWTLGTPQKDAVRFEENGKDVSFP